MKIAFYFTILVIGLGLAVYATPPYQQHYYPPAKQDVVIVKQKVVEFDADTYLGLEGYYSIQNELVDKHGSAAQLKKKDDQIDALIRLLESKYKSDKPGQDNPPVETPANPEQPSQPPSAGEDLNAQVFQIFKKSCATCHGPTQSSGKLRLIGRDDKGEFLVDIGLKSARVYDRVLGNHLKERGLALMPLNKGQLSDEDVSTIHLWNTQNIERFIKND